MSAAVYFGMNPDILDRTFSLAGALVLPVWILLVLAPRWIWTQRLATFVVPLILGFVYIGLLISAPKPAGSGFNSLLQVAALFSARQALLAGWLHYLAFDLFTGAWEARDAIRLGIPKWAVAPCLFLTFLLGPIGLALYLIMRFALRGRMGVPCELEAA